MADDEQFLIIKNEEIDAWKEWRRANYSVKVDLSEADLREANLQRADLRDANLRITE